MTLARDRLLNYAAARAWDVELGPGCRFYGRVSFERSLGSTIRIGGGCTFRSDKTSNRIGVNRPCLISTLKPGATIAIGQRAGLSGTVVGAADSITIGDDVLCGANVTITDTDWHGLAPTDRRKPGQAAPVVIGDSVWLGLNVVVLKGVTIGANTVVAAGSVVSKSLPADVIAGGMPAVPLRPLSAGRERTVGSPL
jgi:acetyltransferase-like isoleucine patch superfamily enzyme